MLACVRALEESGGGFVVAVRRRGSGAPALAGRRAALDWQTPTPSAASSTRSTAAPRLGCPLAAPFGTLSFLALPVIPEFRITNQGLFDVCKQKFVTL